MRPYRYQGMETILKTFSPRRESISDHEGGESMFSWGIIFLIVALIAAALGFGALSGIAAWAAKVVFIVGIIIFIISLFTGRRPPV